MSKIFMPYVRVAAFDRPTNDEDLVHMLRHLRQFPRFLGPLTIAFIFLWLTQFVMAMTSTPKLLTDPFLQLPTESSVRVVWFTDFPGTGHTVQYGPDLKQTVSAKTTQLSRMYEDSASKLAQPPAKVTVRPIWRHEAEVTGLTPGTRLPYRVTSIRQDRKSVSSEVFSLAAKPPAGTPLKVLLTSDHQLKPMAAANLQKMVETVGPVDLVLFAGDLVNVPDRASEWFDCCSGSAFFPVLQGRAHYEMEKTGTKTRYQGGAVIQSTPLYAAIGNHEVMGRFSSEQGLNQQFNDAIPRSVAQARYDKTAATLNPKQDPAVRETWLKNNSFNTDTYEEIFSLPESAQGGKRYYAVTFGDIRLIVLYITNIWRPSSLEPTTRGKYRERAADLSDPSKWGYGQHIFEPIAKGSTQYTWLEQELNSAAFQQAKYKIVMFHHPPHSLGENSVPAYTDPVPVIERDPKGAITSVRYEYPQQADYIVRDLEPLLERAGVQLVFYGHSHLWNRFVSSKGMHFLETSNVGNSYGAYVKASLAEGDDRQRDVPETYEETYAAMGDPNGLQPVVPTIAPLLNAKGTPLPYLSSNDITAFSILDTSNGTVTSYRFDTRTPAMPVIKFDEFQLRGTQLKQ